MATFYVSDLDGTLLRNDAYLSEPSLSVLRRLIARGLTFSVASARSVVSMQPLLAGLELNLPVIEFNGAFVSDLSTGRHELVNAIDSASASEIYVLLQRASVTPLVSTFDGSADRVYFGAITNEGEALYIANRKKHEDPRLKHTDNPAVGLKDQVVCLTVIGRKAALAEIEPAVADRFAGLVEIHLFENRYTPGWYWLTIHDRRATKDQAIRAIRESHGLTDHELVVFGDHVNDVKMFQMATHAIAVANAHPEARRHATTVIGSNEDDSVVRFIEEHYLAALGAMA